MDLPACIENANDLHGLCIGDPRLITFPVDRPIHNDNINHCPTWYTKTAKQFSHDEQTARHPLRPLDIVSVVLLQPRAILGV